MTIEELLYYKGFLKFDSENSKIQIKENELPKFHIDDIYIFDKESRDTWFTFPGFKRGKIFRTASVVPKNSIIFKSSDFISRNERCAGDLNNPSDYFAKSMMTQSNYVVIIGYYDEIEWEASMQTPFPTSPQDFINSYNNNPDFSNFIRNYIIYRITGRYPQNGDVITFQNYSHVFVFSDNNVVWTVKKGNEEVYRVKKGGEVVFQRQYLRGYGDTSLSGRVSRTGTSITWRLTNRDPGVAADTYANVVKDEIASLDFSSGYKRSTTLKAPLSYNDFIKSNLDDGSRYYCRAGLKHLTLLIMPIIEKNYSFYDLPVAAPTDAVIAVSENSATIRFVNNSSTKTIEIFAEVGKSPVTRNTRGTIAAGGFKDVTFPELSSDTTYNLYYYARYVIQSYSPQSPGTWNPSSDLFAEAVDYPISEGDSCTLERGLTYYSVVSGIKAECIGYKPKVDTVYGYLPGPTSLKYYTKSSYFRTNSPKVPTTWTYLTTYVQHNYSYSRGDLPSCDSDQSGALTWLNNNYPPSNYAVGTVVVVNSTEATHPEPVPCPSRRFRSDL